MRDKLPETDTLRSDYEIPPRPFRESPERRDQRIRKHVAQAQEYWAKGALCLREDDMCQAAEKGWGTVAQLTKAVATLKGWNHYDHTAIRDCAYELADENPNQELDTIRGIQAAEHLHGQFYEVYMTRRAVEVGLEDVEPPLEILWGLIPGEYTGGGLFGGTSEFDGSSEK